VSGLPLGSPVRKLAQTVLGQFRVALARDLIEQGVAERLARAALAVGLLWVAIWWALS
jgi:hypothetical protein